MFKSKLKYITFGIIAVLFVTCYIPEYSSAKSVNDDKVKLKNVNTDIKKAKEKLKAGKKKEAEISNKLSKLEADIKSSEKELNEVKASILEAKGKVDIVLGELKEAQSDIDTQDRNLSSRFRNMYKNGFIGFLDIILGSNDVEDVVSNVDMVQKIYDNDKDVLKELKLKHEMIAEKKRELKVLQDSLARKEENERNKKNILAKQKEDYKKLEVKVQADNKALYDHAAALERESANLEALISQAGSSSKYANIKFVGGGNFQWPLENYNRISSYYGKRIHPITKKVRKHHGVDIPAPRGTPVRASRAGVVIKSGWGGGLGKRILISHDPNDKEKLVTVYGHNSKLLVKEGDIVKRGQVISEVGSTGCSSGNHLHFEFRIFGKSTNPLKYARP